MYWKLMGLTASLVVTAGLLLMMRQEKMHLTHEMMVEQSRAREVQQEIWQAEAEAAVMLAPPRLERRARQTDLALEANVPLNDRHRRADVRMADSGETGEATSANP